MTIPNAARLHDPITHSSALAGLIAGVVVGAVVGALVVGTGGAALVVIAAVATGASLGGSIGEVAGSFLTSKAGEIATGSQAVFTNLLPAARAGIDIVSCHRGAVIATGSKTVGIDAHPAARKDDKTQCDGRISDGSPDTFIGGPRVTVVEIDSEVPAWVGWALMAVGLFGAGAAVKAVQAALRFRLIGQMLIGGLGATGAGSLGSWWGGKQFGEGSKEQKAITLLSGLAGGLLFGFGATKVLGPSKIPVPGKILTQKEGVPASERILFRGDKRGTDEIFGKGFQPRDNAKPTDLETYVTKHPKDAQWISTSKSAEVASNPYFTGPEGHTYVVNKSGGLDVNASFPKNPHLPEQEVAFTRSVKPSEIVGAYKLDQGVPVEFVPNPNYTGPPVELPFPGVH